MNGWEIINFSGLDPEVDNKTFSSLLAWPVRTRLRGRRQQSLFLYFLFLKTHLMQFSWCRLWPPQVYALHFIQYPISSSANVLALTIHLWSVFPPSPAKNARRLDSEIFHALVDLPASIRGLSPCKETNSLNPEDYWVDCGLGLFLYP